MPNNNIEAISISTPEAIRLLQVRYPDLAVLPANLHMDDELLARCQFTATLENPETRKRIDFIARYCRVQFHIPFGDTYLETKSPASVMAEVNAIADKGCVIVHQELVLGITGDTQVYPVKGIRKFEQA